MKTIVSGFKARFVILLLGAFMAGCGEGGGSGVTTNTPTKLQVDAKILRTISDISQTTGIEYYFSVSYDGVPSNLAVVSVNGTNVPRVVGFTPGYYDLREPATSYVPGQTYTISIQYSGTTYTETLKAPGGITVNAAGTNVQWIENSDYATISVEHVFGATTYSKKNLPISPAPLASPQVIPSSAYPSADTYRINIWLQNIKKNIGSLNGLNTLFEIVDSRELRVAK